MASYVNPNVRNQGLEYIPTNVTRVTYTVGEPSNYTNATTNNGTGSGQAVITEVVSSEDFTIEDAGSTQARQCVLVAKEGITPVANGTVDHWCWVNDDSDEIIAYGDCPAKALTTDGTVNASSHGIIMPNATTAT